MNQPPKSKDTFFSRLRIKAVAVTAAVFGLNMGYYPRRGSEGKIEIDTVIKEIQDGLGSLNVTVEEAKICLEQVKESYNEVKTATEYQDQKASRLLTILAFLTAAAGAIFTKVIDIYPPNFSNRPYPDNWIIFVIYATFGSYLFLIAVGALTIFYATQTRFVFPKDEDTVKQKLKSLIFFRPISLTEPGKWGQEFTKNNLDLLKQYIEHYVVETYLIAAKTSDKVRFLQPAQDILQFAIKILLLWIICIAVALKTVPGEPKSSAGSTQANNVTDLGHTSASANTAAEPPPNMSRSAHSNEPGATATLSNAAITPASDHELREKKNGPTDSKASKGKNDASHHTD